MASVSTPYAPEREQTTARSDVWATDALLVCMAVVWGVNYVVVKAATGYLAPLAFNAMRVALATVVLGAIAYRLRDAAPPRHIAMRLVLLGTLGHGVYQALFVEGLALTTAGTAALILAASPAFIGIVGRVLRVERPTRNAWAGIALQLAGMAGVVLGAGRHAGAHARSSTVGAMILLAGAMTWAFFAVLLKRFADVVHPIHLSAWTLAGGAVVLGALASPDLAALHPAAVPRVAWGAVLYSGIGALVIAYLFYYRGVRVLGPVKTAMFSNLQPIVALVCAFLVFHEVPTSVQLAGAGLITIGLLVSRR